MGEFGWVKFFDNDAWRFAAILAICFTIIVVAVGRQLVRAIVEDRRNRRAHDRPMKRIEDRIARRRAGDGDDA